MSSTASGAPKWAVGDKVLALAKHKYYEAKVGSRTKWMVIWRGGPRVHASLRPPLHSVSAVQVKLVQTTGEEPEYKIHYNGWNDKHDEFVTGDR